MVVTTLWAVNNLDALRAAGSGVYFYLPKLQTPREALVVERLLSGLESRLGLPLGTLKCKMLYEEGNAGRQLPAIVWALRRRLLGTNVGRWDYLGSLIEMWKDDPQGVFPDPQGIGMATPSMIAYQRYNALLMLMAGMEGGPDDDRRAHRRHGGGHDLPGGRPLRPRPLQPAGAPGHGRRQAPRAAPRPHVRPGGAAAPGPPPTLADILSGKVTGTLHDAYRQSWVASPEADYVAAGNRPLQVELAELQALLDAPLQTVAEVAGQAGADRGQRPLRRRAGAPPVPRPPRRRRPHHAAGARARPRSRRRSSSSRRSAGPPSTTAPRGDVTIEHVQHAFYMAANYGFQILNGNFAAAIDDYELKLRFMNDLATYRINVSWLWTLVRHQAPITKAGRLLRPPSPRTGWCSATPLREVAAGTRFTPALFEEVFDAHDAWTAAFFAEQDRRGDAGPLRPLQVRGHHGAAEAPAPLAAVHPAQRPGPLRPREGAARRSTSRSSPPSSTSSGPRWPAGWRPGRCRPRPWPPTTA